MPKYDVYVNIEIAGYVTAKNELEAMEKAGEHITAKVDKRIIKHASDNYLCVDAYLVEPKEGN